MKQITIIRMVDQIKSPFTGQLSTQNHTVVRSSARSDPITVHWPAVNTVPHGGQVERWIRSNHRSLSSGQRSTTWWSGRALDQIPSPFTAQWSTQYHTVVRSNAGSDPITVHCPVVNTVPHGGQVESLWGGGWGTVRCSFRNALLFTEYFSSKPHRAAGMSDCMKDTV